ANAYKECAEKDPGKYGDAMYWYAVCQRSLGNYAEAEEGLNQYVSNAGENGQYTEAAKKELETISFMREQLARADSVLFTTKKLNIPNSHEKGAFAPAVISGNKFLISSTEPDSVKLNGINPYHSHLFYA